MREAQPRPSNEDRREHDDRRLAPRLARGVVTTVLMGLSLIALINLGNGQVSRSLLSLAVVLMAVLLTLQLFLLTARARRLNRAGRFGFVVVHAAVGFLPFLAFHQAWVGMPGFVAGGALLMLTGWTAVATFVAVVAGTAVIQLGFAPADGGALIAYTTVSTLLTGLITYGLTRMSLLVDELHETRGEMARMAVMQERLRFARDLHDLLGYSLSAITLKSELTRRLVAKNSDRSLIELEEIRAISRQALADVRQLAHGYRDMSLNDEARSARSVLAAADIKVEMELAYPTLPRKVGTILATVLREGVTNLLHHSKAEKCAITVTERSGRVVMTIKNDGVTKALPSTGDGSGICNLTSRVTEFGGSLSAGPCGDDWFVLRVDLPLVEQPASEPAGLLGDADRVDPVASV